MARQQASTRAPTGSRFKFIGETIAELKKVTWPTRQETIYLTTLVVVVSVAIAIALWLFDLGFAKLMEVILF